MSEERPAPHEAHEEHGRLELAEKAVSELAHELRNSLNVILTAAQLVELLPPGDERARHHLKLVLDSAAIMRGQLQELVDVTRIQVGRFRSDASELAVATVLEWLERRWTGRALDRGVTVQVARPAEAGVLYGERDRVVGVLSRIVANAVRNSLQDGAVRVTTRSDPDRVTFVVSHQGRPTPDELLPALALRPGEQPESPWRPDGLDVAGEIARATGGSIRTESDLDGANRVVVTLPAIPPEDEWATGLLGS